jgi:hypothetical protein
MPYTLQSDDFETRVELASGARLYLNLRGGRRAALRESPLLCVFYEGPPPEREMDYLELSLFVLDNTEMVGSVPVASDDAPYFEFLNLSTETNQALLGPLQGAFMEFRARNRARLVELAWTNPCQLNQVPAQLRARPAANDEVSNNGAPGRSPARRVAGKNR